MNEKALTPQQLAHDGRAAYQAGEFDEAARSYSAAAQAFENARDVLAAAEMRNNCCVAWLQARRAAEALDVVQDTPEVFAAAGDAARQGMALGNLASALEATGKIDQAIDVYQQSADCLLQAGETELRAKTMQSLSALLLRTGRQIEALTAMQTGLADIEKPSLKQRALKRLLTMPFRLLNRS